MVSIIGTADPNDAVSTSGQHKTFYAAGLFWVFYRDTFAARVVYRTSSDGENWSAITVLTLTASVGYSLDICFDGTYVHYAIAYGGNCVYRMGTPQPTGSITWAAAEQIVYIGVCYNPNICVDSDGYPWIGFTVKAMGDINGTPYINKSSTNNGTWINDAGFPVQLSVADEAWWRVIPVPLTSLKVYVVYGSHAGVATYGRLYDGGWGAEETIMNYQVMFNRVTAVAYNDDVYVAVAYVTGQQSVYANVRTYGVGWGTTRKIGEGGFGNPIRTIGLCVNQSTGTINIFWGDNYGVHMNSYYNGTWLTNTSWLQFADTAITGYGGPCVAYRDYGNSIIIICVWESGSASPYNVNVGLLFIHSAAIKSIHTL